MMTLFAEGVAPEPAEEASARKERPDSSEGAWKGSASMCCCSSSSQTKYFRSASE